MSKVHKLQWRAKLDSSVASSCPLPCPASHAELRRYLRSLWRVNIQLAPFSTYFWCTSSQNCSLNPAICLQLAKNTSHLYGNKMLHLRCPWSSPWAPRRDGSESSSRSMDASLCHPPQAVAFQTQRFSAVSSFANMSKSLHSTGQLLYLVEPSHWMLLAAVEACRLRVWNFPRPSNQFYSCTRHKTSYKLKPSDSTIWVDEPTKTLLNHHKPNWQMQQLK